MNERILLARDEVREHDRLAIQELGIPAVVLMENAGRAAAQAILELDSLPRPARARRSAVVLCGKGNNGGDGYVVARHLHNAGLAVEVHSVCPAGALSGDAALERAICARMGIPVRSIATAAELAEARARLDAADVVVDALLGTGSRGAPAEEYARAIEAANGSAALTRVALDLPSGLDCDLGEPAQPTFRADLTVTFVAEKQGFAATSAAPFLGRVVVASIGTPPELIERARARRSRT